MSADPFDRVVEILGGLRNGMARCPAHEDRSPSLKVTKNDRGMVLLKCHAGCSLDDILAVLGLTSADLRPAGDSQRTDRPEVRARYPYLSEEGKLLYNVVRYEPGWNGERKTFRQVPVSGKTGPGAMEGVRLVLYRLPDVLAAAARHDVVYVVEGEKDADRLRAEGLVATCNPGGAGKWRKVPDGAKSLVGAEVIIVADKDAAGYRHAADVAVSLLEVGIVPMVVEAAIGKDAADHLGAGRRPEDFVLLAADDIEGVPTLDAWIRTTTKNEKTAPPTTEKTDPVAWDQPVPLDDVQPVGLATFPLDTLPEVIRRQAVDVADSVGASVDLAALAGLGALAALAAPVLSVQAAATWSAPVCLYLVAVERSGGGKSPAFSAMRAPLDQFQAELVEAWREQEYERSALRDAIAAELKEAQRALNGGDRTGLGRIAELKREQAEMAEQTSPRLYLSDATPESLADEMAEQGGAVAVWSDEGSVFDHASGVYSERPSLDVLKRGIDGEPYERRRRNGGVTSIPRCVVTICVATQPVVIEEIGKGSHAARLRGEGVLARFLYAWPAPGGPRDHHQLGAGNHAIRERYAREVLSWARALRDAGPSRMFLSPAARDELNNWANDLERRTQPNAELGEMREWAVKAKGSAARIAALLASFDGAEEVDADTMRRGLAIAGYFLEHARFVFARWSSGPTTRDASMLLDKIRVTWPKAETVTVRDLWRSVRRSFDDDQGPRAMAPALGLLVDTGWLRGPDDWERHVGQRGKAVVFDICPALWLAPMSPNPGDTRVADDSEAA